jgi:MYXO-CTERM domain-containing protein
MLDKSTMSTVIWVLAALILVLYLARRRKRKLIK